VTPIKNSLSGQEARSSERTENLQSTKKAI